LEARALLETYHDLRVEHTAWVQRIHAVLFHQGAGPCPGLRSAQGQAELATVTAACITPAAAPPTTPTTRKPQERIDGKRAALSEARKIVRQACHILTELGEDALTTS
jgi:hypothetical protein